MKFGIKTLFFLTFLACCCMTIYVYFGWEPIVAVLLINAIGVAAGFIVTSILGFPRDGGYRDQNIRRERGQDIVEKHPPAKTP